MGYYRTEERKPTVYERFLSTKSGERGAIRDEVVEMVSRSGIFDVDDLIAVLKVGYRQLPRTQRSEFMRRVLFELKKYERP